MIITFKTHLTEKGGVFDTETFDNNVHNIRAFFEENAQVDIKVLGDYGEREEDAIAIRCMMDDIGQENSYIFSCLSSIIDAENLIEKKVKMLKFLLECYFPCVRDYITHCNNENYVQYVSYYYEEKFLYFKYILPRNLISKCSEEMPDDSYLDLSKLSAEELATYVIPQYYCEISAWDREVVRKDKGLMEFLSIAWFMQAKHGRLD